MNNRFIIFIPSYNNSDWVEYNLASVLNQTYTNWKLVYINDCSTDDTLLKVTDIVGKNQKCTIIDNASNRGGTYNTMEYLHLLEDNDIYVHLDGDDWLIDEHVLENLNNLYNKTDCWMTYGGMVVWDGTNTTPAYPQNSMYDEFVHDYKLYRKDHWRASHLRTYRGFLIKAVLKEDMKELSNKDAYYWHAGDLALQFPCLEMAGKNKVQVVDFYTYVYNQHPNITHRTRQRESTNNSKYEHEIRNRKKYKSGISSGKLPLINAISDYRERNSIPTKFSYVYNLVDGEQDITVIQDEQCLRYLAGEFDGVTGIIVADLYEPPTLFRQREVYQSVMENYKKFDYILTYNKDLLHLPNAIFRNGGHESVLNKNIHKLEYPTLADESLFKMYPKTKEVSIVTSNKQFIGGHIFRVQCVDYLLKNKLNVDIYGVGFNEIKRKLDGLADYRYSIAIENSEIDNYFTEKILDCFLTGTIPIYKGCPNIDEFFNPSGIIKFNTNEELHVIIDKILKKEINIPKEVQEENFHKAVSYCYNADRWFDKFIAPILTKDKQDNI